MSDVCYQRLSMFRSRLYFFFFQAEDGIRDLVRSRGLGDVYKRQAFTWLMILNWRLTSVTAVLLVVFGGGMAYAFTRLRPIFRERGKLNAEVTGRLVESISGIRVVKAYTAERREQHAFAKGANKLFRNVAATMTGVSATTALSTAVSYTHLTLPTSDLV